MQEQIVKILENAVQHKVTKVQAFELAQKLRKVEKTICRTTACRSDKLY